ncbi:condensation domain-containing protein [Bradyrhizobium sp. CIAT3101]|uniref:condensation domain-containing protein n=1 Tax=Bradyrhizobium sp. CIAT3101 TaxID=439387 RepID=UPI0024B283E0|nr:condensation domain-containing protein [Bradyrhizobium sp. CIAT3101]WFU79135.1 condensation domain-containing protein [Bradyrhizobium sp. CIAT3101]
MTVLNPMQGGRGAPGASARSDGDVFAFPVSPAQRRIWIANQKRPASSAYNASFRWSLQGSLDLSALQRSFNEIVARHEVLRATFASVDGDICQLIAPSLSLLIPVVDLRHLSGLRQEAEIDRICAAEAARLFNLERGPLIRVGLLRTDEFRYVLMLTLHHIICDGWSIGVVMRELQKLYIAISEERASDLPSLSIQFPDYVVWSDERAEEAHERELGYWSRKFHGYRPFRLEPDPQAKAERTIDSAIVSRLLPKSMASSLKMFSDQYGGTMFSTTFAACLAMLHRFTGASDIAMWTPLAGRNQPELESLVGLFVNQVALRADLSNDPSLKQLAVRVRDDIWDALAHSVVPFESIMEALPDDAKPRDGQFCFVNFVCQRAFGGAVNSEFDWADVRVAPIPSVSPGALYDLNFFLVERAEGWRLSLEYSTDRYSAATGDRLIDGFEQTLRAIVANPDMKLSELPSAGDHSQNISACPPCELTTSLEPSTADAGSLDDGSEFPASASQKRFWNLSRLRPDDAAFNMPSAVRIAGPLVAELLERSLISLVQRHEGLRTTFREQDGELSQIIWARGNCELHFSDLSEVLPQGNSDLDKLLRDETQKPFDLECGPLARVRLLRLSPEDHVLVVVVHHIISDGWSQSILQREFWAMYEAFAGDRAAALAPLSVQYADFAVWQNQWLESDEANQHLAYWIKSLAGPLPVLDFPSDHPPGQRHQVRGAIERVRLEGRLVERLKERSRSANVTMYMLTLAAFAILLERYTNQQDLTIGSPSANRSTQTESVIGPFSGPIAIRLNLADDPRLSDVLEYVSGVVMDALDHAVLPFESILAQLKMRSVRGRNPLFQFYFLYQSAFLQRREAGNLAITPVPSISVGNPFELQLAIIEREGEVWLTVEYDQGLFEPVSIRNIISYYRSILEEVAERPGKRISQLIPPIVPRPVHPATIVPMPFQEFVGPRNLVEAKLASIWERLFELPKVGVRDDFFELGGHSLLAASLIAEIQKEFGVKTDLSKLLVDRTIEQVAVAITVGNDGQHSSLVPLREAGTMIPLFCVHGGGGHVLAYEELAKALPHDQPVYGLASPELDGAQKAMTVAELAKLYNSEIRRTQAKGPYRICGYSFGGVVAFEMAAQLIAEGEEVPILVMLDTGNLGYYRHLPFKEWYRFWGVRGLDRIKRYYRRIADHRADVAVSSAVFFLRKNLRLQLWKFAQRVARLAGRPMPVQLRDNLTMFKAVARSYRPKPISARIILFRVEGRDPEYDLNKSLGWELVALKGVSVNYVPGDHLSFMREPHVCKVAEQLRSYLS